MPTNERSLWVRLGLSSKQYNKGFDRAEKRQNQFKKQTAKIGPAIKASIAGIGVAAVGSYISTVIRAQTETQQWADRIGIGVEALQELQFAGKKYGITQDAITDGLKELSLRTDEFVKTGIGPAAEAFKRLGLEQEELNKVSGDTEKLFELVHSRIQNVGNVAARQRIADELFGGQGGEQFVELLSTSSGELDAIRKEARDMGAVVDKEASKSIEKLSTNIKNLGSAISGTSGSIVGEMAPALNKMVQGLTTAISHTGNLFTLLSTGVKASLGIATRKDLQAALKSGKSILGLSKEINNQLGGAIQEGLAGLGPGKATGGTKGGALAQMITGGGDDDGDGGDGNEDKFKTINQLTKELTNKQQKLAAEMNKTFGERRIGLINQLKDEIESLKEQTKNWSQQLKEAKENIPGEVEAQGIDRLATSFNTLKGSIPDKEIRQVSTGGKEDVDEMKDSVIVLGNAFRGFQGVIEETMSTTRQFHEVFIDFLKQMITKLIAAAIAAFALAVAVTLFTAGANLQGAFKSIGKMGGMMGGFGSLFAGEGLAEGGQTKTSGTFIVGERGPEAVTMPSGSTVRPLSNTPSGAGEGRLVAVVTGEQLNFIQEKYNRKKGNTY